MCGWEKENISVVVGIRGALDSNFECIFIELFLSKHMYIKSQNLSLKGKKKKKIVAHEYIIPT